MNDKMRYQMGPESTPRPLKLLLWITAGVSLASAFFPWMQGIFSLSWEGIRHLAFWQFFTYLFVQPDAAGLSFSSLLHLSFNLYLLWTFGASLIERSRPLLFFTLYFGSGLFAGLLALAPMALFSLPTFLAGNSTALYAVLVAWVMVNPESELLLFFTFPLKARWLILGLIGANLLLDLSHGDWIHFFSFSGSALFGYFFALIAWREQSPYFFLRSFERMVLRILERMLEKWRRFGKKNPAAPYRHSKIYDIRSGAPLLDDDDFMDAMLTRISLYGEDSLSADEKKRMQSISAKKAANNRPGK